MRVLRALIIYFREDWRIQGETLDFVPVFYINAVFQINHISADVILKKSKIF